ncbi:unnamed protein product [Dovyalis caffra]|uniref:Uncharacterized protein n=1 Tax=Dovyalis caffra TaxID=77055 RepID=A0AAV1SHT6_9ROSI|nr:unnamed protein product [Dovyalis caffra]
MESKKISLVVVVAMVLALTLAQSSFARVPYPFILDAVWVDDQTMIPGELIIEEQARPLLMERKMVHPFRLFVFTHWFLKHQIETPKGHAALPSTIQITSCVPVRARHNPLPDSPDNSINFDWMAEQIPLLTHSQE